MQRHRVFHLHHVDQLLGPGGGAGEQVLRRRGHRPGRGEAGPQAAQQPPQPRQDRQGGGEEIRKQNHRTTISAH